MKNILFVMIVIIFNTNLFCQEQELKLEKNTEWYMIILTSDTEVSDTIARYKYDIELLDYLIINDNTVSYVIETPFSFDYEKFIKKDSKWNWSKTSGFLSSNYKNMSYRTAAYYAAEGTTFEIIGEDLVSIKNNKGEETIKDCTEFKKEREAREEDWRKH